MRLGLCCAAGLEREAGLVREPRRLFSNPAPCVLSRESTAREGAVVSQVTMVGFFCCGHLVMGQHAVLPVCFEGWLVLPHACLPVL